MMPIERMRPEDFDAVFRLLARSFPAGERRDKAGQRALLADSAYQIDILRAPSGGVQALMASWDFGGFVFFEHFAVDPACRNGGIGGQMLDALLARFDKPACLEAELPETELAARRIGFYERHGFTVNADYPYFQPALHANNKQRARGRTLCGPGPALCERDARGFAAACREERERALTHSGEISVLGKGIRPVLVDLLQRFTQLQQHGGAVLAQARFVAAAGERADGAVGIGECDLIRHGAAHDGVAGRAVHRQVDHPVFHVVCVAFFGDTGRDGQLLERIHRPGAVPDGIFPVCLWRQKPAAYLSERQHVRLQRDEVRAHA